MSRTQWFQPGPLRDKIVDFVLARMLNDRFLEFDLGVLPRHPLGALATGIGKAKFVQNQDYFFVFLERGVISAYPWELTRELIVNIPLQTWVDFINDGQQIENYCWQVVFIDCFLAYNNCCESIRLAVLLNITC